MSAAGAATTTRLRDPRMVRAHLARGGGCVAGPDGELRIDVAVAPDVAADLLLRWRETPGILELTLPFPVAVTEEGWPRLADAVAVLGEEAWLPGFVLGRDRLEYRLSLFLDGDGAIEDRALDRALAVCRATARKSWVRLRAAAGTGAAREHDVTLSSDELARVREVVRAGRPTFAARLDRPVRIREVEQTFFLRHRILVVESPAPIPAAAATVALAPRGRALLLSGCLEGLAEIARADPPPGLDDPARALRYGHVAGDWTRERDVPDFPIGAFAEIPWRAGADPDLVRRLHERHAAAIEPGRLERTARGHRHTAWIVADGQLLRRVMEIPTDGRLERAEALIAAGLPVPSGRFWGWMNGRLVPIG